MNDPYKTVGPSPDAPRSTLDFAPSDEQPQQIEHANTLSDHKLRELKHVTDQHHGCQASQGNRKGRHVLVQQIRAKDSH